MRCQGIWNTPSAAALSCCGLRANLRKEAAYCSSTFLRSCLAHQHCSETLSDPSLTPNQSAISEFILFISATLPFNTSTACSGSKVCYTLKLEMRCLAASVRAYHQSRIFLSCFLPCKIHVVRVIQIAFGRVQLRKERILAQRKRRRQHYHANDAQ